MRLFLSLLLLIAYVVPVHSADRFTNGYRVKVFQGSGTRVSGVGGAKVVQVIHAVAINAQWSDARIYFLRSTQNAGTGSVVYTAGGWSADNAILMGSPTWGTAGISFNGTSQYCTDPNDIWSGGTGLTLLVDFVQSNKTLLQAIVGALAATSPTNNRSWELYTLAGDTKYTFATSVTGTVTTTPTFGTIVLSTAKIVGASYAGGGTTTGYVDGSAFTISATSPLFDSTVPIMVGASNSGSPINFFSGSVGCVVVIKSTVGAIAFGRLNTALIGLR